MTQPAGAAGQTIVQQFVEQFVQQLTAPLQEAATAFSTTIAETLAKDIEQTTKAFKQAHPAVAQVTGSIVGWTTVVAESTGSIAAMSGNTVDMIRSTRDLRQEITRILNGIPALDGLRLRLMYAGDAMRKLDIGAKLAAASSRAWTAVQRVLNVVLTNNPLGRIITVITLLVGAIVLAYQRSTTFRNIVNAAFNAVRTVVMAVFTVIRNAVAVVWPYVRRVIEVAVKAIRAYVTTYFTIVRTVVTTVFNAVRTIVTAVWNGIRGVISGAVTAVVRTVQGIGQVFTLVRDAFNRARSAAGEAIGGLVGLVRALPGRVVTALGNIGRSLYSSGRDLIMGFIEGIRDMAGRIVSAIKDFILDKIPGPIKSFLGISSPSQLMAGIGRDVGEGLAVGIEGSRDTVGRAMERLVPLPRAGLIRPVVAGLAGSALTAGTIRHPATATRQAVTVNVYPQPGQSEYEIGRVAARELAWAAKY